MFSRHQNAKRTRDTRFKPTKSYISIEINRNKNIIHKRTFDNLKYFFAR